jgi:hypothetical protein
VGSASRDLGEVTGSRNEVKSAAAEGKVEEVVGTRELGQSQMVFLWYRWLIDAAPFVALRCAMLVC